MIKFRLYKFLGTFIPYFKRKMMNRDTMLSQIDNVVRNHIKGYSNITFFDFEMYTNTCSTITVPYLKINYKVMYQLIEFFISTEYFEDEMKIKMSGNFDNCDEEFIEISEFYKYFRLIDKTNLFQTFNVFKPYMQNYL